MQPSIHCQHYMHCILMLPTRNIRQHRKPLHWWASESSVFTKELPTAQWYTCFKQRQYVTFTHFIIVSICLEFHFEIVYLHLFEHFFVNMQIFFLHIFIYRINYQDAAKKSIKFKFFNQHSVFSAADNFCTIIYIFPHVYFCSRVVNKSQKLRHVHILDSAKKGFRSNSAIDLQAAQRAKARSQYAAMERHKIASGTASLRKLSIVNCFDCSNKLKCVAI